MSDEVDFESLKHHVEYGQRGEPQTQRVLAYDWGDIEQFSKPVPPCQWNIIIPRADLSKIINGFQPQAMEDKWFIYTDGPDGQGNAVVHMHRSWTGYKLIELKIKVPIGEDGKIRGEDSRITEIVWEEDEERFVGSEKLAKEYVMEICNWVLHVKLKEPES
jgi:hypothetical protein